jgi:hypothetical protein
MIPNTDINCGKCATPMFSDCVLWSGSQSTVACIPLSSAGKCCDSSITQVITDVAQFACDTNVSDLANYNYTCLASTCSCSITDFFDLFNLVITKVCNLEAGTIVVGDLDWNCYAAPASAVTGITEVIQYLIDQTCTTGKPSDLNTYCYTLPETYDINTVLEAIMQQTCDKLQLSGLTWGSCFSSPVSNSLQAVIQNILTTVCSITNLSLNWGCFVNTPPSGVTTINSSFQNIINEVNYRFDFQNINWTCISGTTSCSTTASAAFNKLITYMCSKFDMTGINWGCFTGTTATTTVAVINQLITELCNISLSWGCLTPTTGLASQLQTIITAINAQTIAYNSTYFVVSGSSCSNRSLNIKQGTWVNVPAGSITYYSAFSGYTGGAFSGISYMIEPATNTVRIKGLVNRPWISSMTSTSGGGSINYANAFVGIRICSIAVPGLIPNSTGDTPIINAAGFNNTYAYAQGNPVTQYYNLSWIVTIGASSGNTGIDINAYVPYGATQNGASVAPQNDGTVSIYLHDLKYTLN